MRTPINIISGQVTAAGAPIISGGVQFVSMRVGTGTYYLYGPPGVRFRAINSTALSAGGGAVNSHASIDGPGKATVVTFNSAGTAADAQLAFTIHTASNL